MKKIHGKSIFGAVCCLMAIPLALPLAACKGCGDKKNDTETRPVTVAIGATDENFNPFFYTAQNDGEVISPTQIQMITADKNGKVACGQNEATVALAYKQTMYDAANHETQEGSKDGTTVYEFVIKNGIKFSDGVDLTIKDVLFNLYTYLDPMYSGSSTIYSTKIKGLAAYRAQQSGLGDDAGDEYKKQFETAANNRVNALFEYDDGKKLDETKITSDMEKDLITVGKKFREELTTDWNNNVGSLDGYKDEYRFTEDWEVYMFNEGFITYQYYRNSETNSLERQKDPDGKYYTTLDKIEGGLDQSHIRGLIEAASAGLSGDAKEEAIKKEAIDIIYEDYLKDTYEGDNLVKVRANSAGRLRRVINEWATGSTVRQEFLNEAMSDYYNSGSSTGLKVKEISGIETYKTTASEFGTIDGGSALDKNETYDVLKITINGVDPAAIWNFGYTVAPMHYYSGTLGGVDYVAECDPANKEKANRFGVAFANKDFFDAVLNAPEKVKKPVGAGPYKVIGDNVYVNKEAKYERNTYFETVGSGLKNAAIKNLIYRTISEDQLVTALINRDVDYGSPNCTPKIITQINGQGLQNISYDANGFGYVGINPKYIPERQIRQVIMRAMNVVSITANYYTKDYASVIYRPISTTSWVYTESSDAEKKQYFGEIPTLAYAGSDTSVYTNLLDEAECYQENGLWYNKEGKQLKYTFTIAGESIDHPAYDMFKAAAEILNGIGMEITVTRDIQALSKLAQGKLTVWAAAWSSGIDPDMYQVYHKDSKATSVKNWGYDVILQDNTGKYDYEKARIEELSDLIEEGREVLNRDSRRRTYYQALNKVMELAVELPTYQRKDLVVYNGDVINEDSLNKDANANAGVLNRLWELDYV